MEWTVSYDESGNRLVDFIFSRLKGVNGRKAIRRTLEQNGCLVNGKVERFATVPVNRGDKVRFRQQVQSTPKGQYTFESSRVLYQDDYLLVYNKPIGVSVEKLQPLLKGWQMVHRIDRYTSGAWILAKAGQPAAEMERQFRQRLINKKYLAVVDGVPGVSSGVESTPVDGRPAITRWELVKAGRDQSVVACYPESGRHHQVRIHMQRMGHPLVGDRDYASSFRCAHLPPHYLLHASEVSFAHPLSGELATVKAPNPSWVP